MKFFSEDHNSCAFAGAGLDNGWVQDNHAMSREKAPLRGLRFQSPPQAKLIRVARGAIFEVAADISGGSPGFGEWLTATLRARA